MVEDDRGSRRTAIETTQLAGGASSTVDILNLSNNETFHVESIKLEYSSAGSTEGELELHDDATGTAAGNLGSAEDKYFVRNGTRDVISDVVYEEFEKGIVLNPDGSHDDKVQVTVSGYYTTQ